MKDTLKRLITLLLMCVVIGVVFAFVFDFLQEEKQVAHVKQEDKTVAENTISTQITQDSMGEGIQNAVDAVYSVNVSQSIQGFGEQSVSSGSGVVYKEDEQYYYFLTNAHVVENGNAISIRMNEKDVEAELVGLDRDTDLAILKVKKDSIENKLTVAKLGNSSDLELGETVFAIGNALGYGKSITKGIISATNRSYGFSGDFAYKMIQTDAAINPGNSGGALVNMNGEVIGINSSKIAQVRDISVEGISFAIPIDAAKEIGDSILEKGYYPKTFLGVSTQNLYLLDLDQKGIPRGVRVVEVYDNTPASKAGLQYNDLITKVDETTIETGQDLSNYIKSKKPGDEVKITVFRGNATLDLKAVLSESSQK